MQIINVLREECVQVSGKSVCMKGTKTAFFRMKQSVLKQLNTGENMCCYFPNPNIVSLSLTELMCTSTIAKQRCSA